jgi:para-nitrobenzyl esterase
MAASPVLAGGWGGFNDGNFGNFGGNFGGGHGGSSGGPVVNTQDGPVQGYTKNGVNIFLGIPYAAPPVGRLRWEPPQPPKKHGLLDATKFASTCPQVTELGAFAGPSSASEDCLYLNVFTSNRGWKKPVLVWIHGGGNVDGETNDYDGSKLATGGPNGSDTVVVTLNYRLGLFGFLSHPALNSEGHLWGNYGILDQQAVLRWVQKNIAAFGGDPTRVALGGQSAGAQDTGANVLSPYARGLFNRAIYESAPLSTMTPASVALTKGMNFATAANCPGSNAAAAACLRNLSTARILQLQGTPNANGPYITGPFVDGTIIPISPETAWTTGAYNHMPTMGGAVHDEGNFSISIAEYFTSPQAPQTDAQYVAAVTAAYSGNAGPGGTPPAYPAGTAAAVLAQYPPTSFGGTPTNTQGPYDRVTTDPGKCRGLHVLKLWAPHIPTYGYDFTYLNAPYYFPHMPGFTAAAYHTSDIQFLFAGWHGGQLGVNLDQTTGQPRELNASETVLSDNLVAAWTNFAKTGNPNASGNSPWPQFTTSSPKFLAENLSLSSESEAQFRATYNCDFWDTVLVY